MTAPTWAVFGILAACFSAAQMLIQERFKAPPFAVAFWSKCICALVMMPFVLVHGLPSHLNYYALVIAQSLLWVVADVVFYRSINEAGAGVIARLMPLATICSFFLWFVISWHDVAPYIANPGLSTAIITILVLLAFFVWRLKNCTVTGSALRSVWFVLFAAIVGSVSTKYITRFASMDQGVYATTFSVAVIMVLMWIPYYLIKKPLPHLLMFNVLNLKAGIGVGLVAACATATSIYAIYNIDNPAYVSAVRYLDAPLILLIYYVTGKPLRGRIWAGLGVVACAAALIVVKTKM